MRFIVLLGFIGTAACGFEGGANSNQKTVGNEMGGVDVALGDIAVSPTGDYVVASNAGALTILRPGFVANPAGAMQVTVPRTQRVPVQNATKLGFAWSHPTFYVTTSQGTLDAIDARSGKSRWSSAIAVAHSTIGMVDTSPESILEVSKDDRRVVFANGHRLTILDAADGRVVASAFSNDVIEDVDLLPDGLRAVMTTRTQRVGTERLPETTLGIVTLEDGTTKSIRVPNCHSNLVVSPDGARAFLAPTVCGRDPVSVIDLDAERFVRNLPGFGPVAMAPDGVSLVAFMDARSADTALFDDPKQIPDRMGPQYHLMVIDAATLRFRLAPIGDDLPRYAMTPDGKVLLVDNWWHRQTLRLFDVATMGLRDVDGPALLLSNFVMTPDSTRAFALDMHQLFEVDIAGAKAEHLMTPDDGFQPPKLDVTSDRGWSRQPGGVAFIPGRINISPDGNTLYLRASSVQKYKETLSDRLCVYSIAQSRCTEWFSLE